MEWRTTLLEYVKIPKSLIENKNLGEKRIVTYLASVFSERKSATNNYKLEVTVAAGYSNDRHSDCALDTISQIIDKLDGGYLTYEKQSKKQSRRLAHFIDKSEYHGIIYREEFEKVMEAKEKYKQNGRRINQAHILLLLSYIRLRTYHLNGYPEYASDLLCRISDSIGISARCISSSLRILEELHIIHSEELPRYVDSEMNWHSNVRIFVDYEKPMRQGYDWQQETIKGIRTILSYQVD